MVIASEAMQGERPCTSHCETAENYFRVVYLLGDLRVIECRDGIQWIIQHRSGLSTAGPRWRSLAYCTTRQALIRVWTGKTGETNPALGNLPLTIGGR